MSKLELKTEYSGATARLICSGRIVAGAEGEELDSTMQQLLRAVANVHLDLEQVTFLDSSGIGVLVRNLVRARADNKQIRISAMSPQARSTLEITNLLGQFRTTEGTQPRLRAGLRVLFVHPSAEIRTFVSSLLESRGAAVKTCASMYDARMMGVAGSSDLVIVPAEIDPSALSHPNTLRLSPSFFDCNAENAADALIAQINSAAH
jgi:anti-anti-sigma factor